MSRWVCPTCATVLPTTAIKPSGAIVCPNCSSDLRLAQPVRGVISVMAIALPFAVLIPMRALTVPWVIIALLIAPYMNGVFLLLIRSIIGLPLTVYRGPFDHFTMK